MYNIPVLDGIKPRDTIPLMLILQQKKSLFNERIRITSILFNGYIRKTNIQECVCNFEVTELQALSQVWMTASSPVFPPTVMSSGKDDLLVMNFMQQREENA